MNCFLGMTKSQYTFKQFRFGNQILISVMELCIPNKLLHIFNFSNFGNGLYNSIPSSMLKSVSSTSVLRQFLTIELKIDRFRSSQTNSTCNSTIYFPKCFKRSSNMSSSIDITSKAVYLNSLVLYWWPKKLRALIAKWTFESATFVRSLGLKYEKFQEKKHKQFVRNSTKIIHIKLTNYPLICKLSCVFLEGNAPKYNLNEYYG